MLLSKLAKAKNASNPSPRNGSQYGSGSKRTTLEIFSHFRQVDQYVEQQRAQTAEDEIELMLDQNLFRGNQEAPETTLIKQFQIASDNVDDILSDNADTFSLVKEAWTPMACGSSQTPIAQTKSTAVSSLTPGARSSYFGGAISDYSQALDSLAEPFKGGAEPTAFSLFTPTTGEADLSRGVSQMTPKLNAQTLFAFGHDDAFSNAFSDATRRMGEGAPANPWAASARELPATTKQNVMSTQEQNLQHPFWPGSQSAQTRKEDLHNSMDSNSLEEIFTNALNLDEKPGQQSFNGSGFGGLHQESTQDDSSFQSQARSDLAPTPTPFAFNSAEQKQFVPTNQGFVFRPAAQTYPFMTDVSSFPVFKPTNFVFNPSPAPKATVQQMATFNQSDGQSTYASSTALDTSAEFSQFAPTGQKANPAGKLYELPQHLADQLSAEDIDIIFQVETLAFDQAGCRMIQRKLEDNFAEKTREGAFAAGILHVMHDILPDVMTNQFGNYLCQKLIEVCPTASLKQLVHAVLPSVVEISMDLHGTRVIQTLVEVLGREPAALHHQILAMGAEMSQYIFDLSTHPNGNHVIQAFLLTFKASETPEEGDSPGAEAFAAYTQFIFGACMAYCDQIGSDKHGCCVMQRCLEKGLTAQKFALADVIIRRIHFLIEDPYGNYLVQNVLKLKNEMRNDQILNFIAGDFVRLSQLKFSSNVIEKCLETRQAAFQIDQIFKGTHYWDDQVLLRELGHHSRNRELRVNQIVQRLVQHQFGNYVLQKAIAIIEDPALKTQLLESIKLLSDSLSQTKHGQKVLTKLQKGYPHIFVGASAGGASKKNFSGAPSTAGGQQKKKSANRKRGGQPGRSGAAQAKQ